MTIQIDNVTQDTIIRLICATFNLSYTKDGNVYHLAKKWTHLLKNVVIQWLIFNKISAIALFLLLILRPEAECQVSILDQLSHSGQG